MERIKKRKKKDGAEGCDTNDDSSLPNALPNITSQHKILHVFAIGN
jgi:hypothetical protein